MKIAADRKFPSIQCQRAFENGFDAMSDKIAEVGFEACRQEFNSIYPPGQPFGKDISELGIWFARGEFEALSRNAR